MVGMMTTEITRYTGMPSLDEMQRAAKMLAASTYFDAKGDSPQAIAQIATKIMAGAELGFGPFASVTGIHLINGKLSIGANLMASAVKAHALYNYRVRKLDIAECSIEFFAGSETLGISTFTKQDAETAGLLNNPTWKKFPKNMLFARALSNGVRFYAPDVFNGNAVYVPEELGALTDDNGDYIDVTSTPLPPTGGVKVEEPDAEMQALWEDAPPIDQDGPAVEAPAKLGAITKTQQGELHALGTAYYNGDWDKQRPILVKSASKGASESSKDLTQVQAQKLIDGLQSRLAVRVIERAAAENIDLNDILPAHKVKTLDDASPVALTHIYRDVMDKAVETIPA